MGSTWVLSAPDRPHMGPMSLGIRVVTVHLKTYAHVSCAPLWTTVYPKKYAHGFCFAMLCCGYTLTDFPISIRLTSLALWQSNDCPSASKATLMDMDKYFMWIHYERLHNHNKAKHNKTVCIFLGIYCIRATMYYVLLLETQHLTIWFHMSHRSNKNCWCDQSRKCTIQQSVYIVIYVIIHTFMRYI